MFGSALQAGWKGAPTDRSRSSRIRTFGKLAVFSGLFWCLARAIMKVLLLIILLWIAPALLVLAAAAWLVFKRRRSDELAAGTERSSPEMPAGDRPLKG